MEASVSQEGTTTTTQDTGTQEGAQVDTQPQVPPEVAQRLDEISGRFDQFEPLLQQALTPPQQEQAEEPQQGYEDFVDPETGYVLDPAALQQYNDEQVQKGIQEALTPIQQQVQQLRQEREDEALDGLMQTYPALQEGEAAQQLAADVHAYAQQVGNPNLATDPRTVEMVYLAGLARQQAQQGVPAGAQQVHLEGGSGTPGQPEGDPKQEWFGGMQFGAQSGPFGRPIDQL